MCMSVPLACFIHAISVYAWLCVRDSTPHTHSHKRMRCTQSAQMSMSMPLLSCPHLVSPIMKTVYHTSIAMKAPVLHIIGTDVHKRATPFDCHISFGLSSRTVHHTSIAMGAPALHTIGTAAHERATLSVPYLVLPVIKNSTPHKHCHGIACAAHHWHRCP